MQRSRSRRPRAGAGERSDAWTPLSKDDGRSANAAVDDARGLVREAWHGATRHELHVRGNPEPVPDALAKAPGERRGVDRARGVVLHPEAQRVGRPDDLILRGRPRHSGKLVQHEGDVDRQDLATADRPAVAPAPLAAPPT